LLRWHRETAKHKWRRWRRQRGPGRPRSVPSSSTSSFGSVGRTAPGGACASRANCESSASASRRPRSAACCAVTGSDLHHGEGQVGPSSFTRGPRASSRPTSSAWTR
jgi:hypothetical protein